MCWFFTEEGFKLILEDKTELSPPHRHLSTPTPPPPPHTSSELIHKTQLQKDNVFLCLMEMQN